MWKTGHISLQCGLAPSVPKFAPQPRPLLRINAGGPNTWGYVEDAPYLTALLP
jgi:hypothetical protein